MNARVAVVVRSRGEAAPLERALKSVRSQTFADWMLVLAVGDGDDATAVERLAKGDERVATVRASTRGALANAALAAVDSELAVLHDDDGSWHPRFLELAVAHLDGAPDEVAVATRAEVVIASADPARPELEVRRVLAPDEPAVSLVALVSHNFVPPASLVFRRSAYDRLGGYDETLPALEDWEFLLRLVALGPVGFLADQPLAGWYPDPLADVRWQTEASELQLRDGFLRRDLLAPGAEGGLGAQLALAHQLRRLGRAHQDHVDAVATDLKLELGRLRGELLMMRETLVEVQEDFVVLSDQVLDAVSAARGRDRSPAQDGGNRARRRARTLRGAVRRVRRRWSSRV